ncbi:mechanosensitive ion channel family protein [Pelotomaculum propionicicum]|uniref:Small-conductance mechanosensitive channel n=1 Tax=Pelotomaculum propionicicum TaxID=258475 RepID=A0A4Y7RUP4_9FIRM|nr:mechanosensitive ion channel family protein [Pelotomaculum propionicicum]NLI12683.1 mechanosensitive ion channel family protein [Peptococcaceae bacterium]TEB12601.1 Small-conductance mechanosensitive channel [Pelotomaculum propionicicum]
MLTISLSGCFNLNIVLLAGKTLAGIIACFVVAWLAGKLWDVFVGKLAGRSSLGLYNKLVTASHRHVVIFIFLASLRSTIWFLSTDPGWPGPALTNTLDKLLYTILIVVLAHWIDLAVQAAADWYSNEYSDRTQGSLEQFMPLLRQLSRLLIYFLALTYILEYFGKNITGLIATAGVASLAIALAAQETLSNMFAGLMLMLDRPFRPGDRIELDKGHIGDVLQIGTRTTRILTLDNNLIVVPNKDLANSRIINHVFPSPHVSLNLNIGVTGDTDLAEAKRIILEILHANQIVLDDPAPGVFFTGFAESHLNLAVNFWIENYKDSLRVKDQLNSSIKESFEKAGIGLPYPRRDVRIIDKIDKSENQD